MFATGVMFRVLTAAVNIAAVAITATAGSCIVVLYLWYGSSYNALARQVDSWISHFSSESSYVRGNRSFYMQPMLHGPGAPRGNKSVFSF